MMSCLSTVTANSVISRSGPARVARRHMTGPSVQTKPSLLSSEIAPPKLYVKTRGRPKVEIPLSAVTESRPKVTYHIRPKPYTSPKVKRDFRPKTETESQSYHDYRSQQVPPSVRCQTIPCIWYLSHLAPSCQPGSVSLMTRPQGPTVPDADADNAAASSV